MKKLLFVLLSFTMLAACNKDQTGPGDDILTLLVDRKWITTYAESKDAAGNVSTDLLRGQAEYLNDDYYFWSSKRTYLLSDNKILRDNSPITLDEGSWILDNSTIVMTSQMQGTNYRMKVLELTANAMRAEVAKEGQVYTYTFAVTE